MSPRLAPREHRPGTIGASGIVTYSRVKAETGMNVMEAARARIAWLFEEFDGNVHVAISGGKDSTVVMELAAEAARARGERLSVYCLDQEAEWQSTRDHLRHTADRDDIDMTWYQVPFRLFNATSIEQEWGHMWPTEEPEGGWVRPPEPDAVREPFPNADRFGDVLEAIQAQRGGAHLTGMRVEESPTRRLGSTVDPCYRWITWGRAVTKLTKRQRAAGEREHWTFNPIYDWSFRDVWHAIESEEWEYNRLYDEMFRYGVRSRDMRVSSLVHEHSLTSLTLVQEIEPQTWERMVQRFPGINSYGHVGETIEEEYVRKRPHMFDTWHDYLEHLLTTIVPSEKGRETIRKMRVTAQRELPWLEVDVIDRHLVAQALRNDYWHTSAFGKWILAQKHKQGRSELTAMHRERAGA